MELGAFMCFFTYQSDDKFNSRTLYFNEMRKDKRTSIYAFLIITIFFFQFNSCKKDEASNPAPFTAISAGGAHSIALKNDHTLWAWGLNSFGQLGVGTTIDKKAPVQVIEGYELISAGGTHTLALKTDGTLWAWGRNTSGQLGDETNTDRDIPVLIGEGYTAISAGGCYNCFVGHSLALKSDGTLWAWGNNAYGQLGDGTNTDRNSPVQIGSGYSAISAGDQFSLALKTDGSLWAWGRNYYGQLGDGTNTNKNVPVMIGSGFTAISASQGNNTSCGHSLALKSDHTMWAWGYNSFGQLGDGTFVDKNLPVQIGSGFSSISAGGIHSLALKTDGTVWAFGNNDFGQLGDGTHVQKTPPVQIGSGYSAISAGALHSMALKKEGTIWAWGWNHFGQLGDSTTVDKLVPDRIGVP
jgi:alpha-tubulin suppressor-like RCC1 family protein